MPPKNMKRPAILLLTSFVVAVAVALSIDLQFVRMLSESPKWLISTFRMIGHAGDATFPIAGSIILFLVLRIVVLLRPRAKTIAWLKAEFFSRGLFLSLMMSGLLVHVVKFFVGRRRPYIENYQEAFVFDPMTTNWSFHSFPSGHTQAIATTATVFALFFPRLRWPAFFLVCAVGLSRIFTGSHFLSDVIFGGCVGYFGASLVLFWMRQSGAKVFSAPESIS